MSTRPVITCSACGHDGPLGAHGWCRACYQRWLRAGRPAAGPPPERRLDGCGTRAGYQRHRWQHQNACLRCQDAAAAYQREYRTRRTRKATAA